MNKTKLFFGIIGVLVLLNIFLWMRVADFGSPEKTEAYFFSVGQGDSSLVLLADGKKILIDGGSNDLALEQLNSILEGNRYIDIVLMSHAHADHYRGLIDVLEKYEIGVFLGSGRKGEGGSYDELMRLLNIKGITYIPLAEGANISLGEASIQVLSPSSREILSDNPNDASLVLLFDVGNFTLLYTGDAGVATEKRMIEKYDLRADVLKVGHQGSKTSSDESFLAEVLPSFSIISVGKNTYGHPHAEVVERLLEVGQLFRTDEQGMIRISENDGLLQVERLK